MQTASATYPCPYCNVSLTNLRDRQSLIISSDNNEESMIKNEGDDMENINSRDGQSLIRSNNNERSLIQDEADDKENREELHLKTYGDLRK